MLWARSSVRFTALVALLAALAVGVVAVGPPSPRGLTTLVSDLGLFGPVLVVVVSAVLLAALVPRTALAAAAGLVFGPVVGAGYVLAGVALGALTAFGVGRWLGRDFVASRSRMARLDGWLAARGVWGVVVLRLLPLAPFGLVSYAFGTTAVSLRAYLIGTAVGALPSTVIYAHLGASAMSPGSAPFMWSLAAAIALGVGCAAATRVVLRRKAASTAQPAAAVRLS